MVHRMGADHKVGIVGIYINQGNPIDGEVIKTMRERWTNVYNMEIWDNTATVEESVYEEWFRMAEQRTLVGLEMWFWGGLKSSEDGLKVIKRLNQIAKQKEGMDWLRYEHDRVNDWARTPEKV